MVDNEASLLLSLNNPFFVVVLAVAAVAQLDAISAPRAVSANSQHLRNAAAVTEVDMGFLFSCKYFCV